MPREGARGKKLSIHKFIKGFCVSCGASKSSRFRPALLKWKAFYQLYDDERNEEKIKICTRCYLKLSKSCKLPTNNTDSSTTNQVSVLVKPSPISGNGQCLPIETCLIALLINKTAKNRPFCAPRFCQRRSRY